MHVIEYWPNMSETSDWCSGHTHTRTHTHTHTQNIYIYIWLVDLPWGIGVSSPIQQIYSNFIGFQRKIAVLGPETVWQVSWPARKHPFQMKKKKQWHLNKMHLFQDLRKFLMLKRSKFYWIEILKANRRKQHSVSTCSMIFCWKYKERLCQKSQMCGLAFHTQEFLCISIDLIKTWVQGPRGGLLLGDG